MHRKCNSLTCLVAFIVGCLLIGTSRGQSRPNVILVMADDMGWGDVGYNGHPNLQTPHLDRMAKEGVRFNRFYAASAVCSPTRASCLTGRHSVRLGIHGANNGHMPSNEQTLAETLKGSGYRTGHFGKWHLGTLTRKTKDSNRGGPRGIPHYAPPWDHGFDSSFSTEAKVPTFNPMQAPLSTEVKPYGTSYWVSEETRATSNLEGDDSRIIMDRVVPFIEGAAQAKRPFFCVVWFHAPHLPIVADPEQLARYPASLPLFSRHYYGCISALDKQVGRLRKALASLGVSRNTMLFFCSDNGPEGRKQGLKAPGRTRGLRGRKRSLFEGGIRVPGLLVWPARFPAPRVIDAPCVTSDYVPTILDALGIESKMKHDGCSLMPLLTGEASKRPRPIGFQNSKMAVWMTDRWKLVMRGRSASPLLYDIKADPAEKKNLAAQYSDRVKDMLAALNTCRADCRQTEKTAER